MPLNEQEKLGITDLLLTEQNIPVLIQFAKSLTKSCYDVASTQEALDVIFTHIGDTYELLNKRNITKEILFKYLHHKNIAIKSDFTKHTLINRVLEYWQCMSMPPAAIITTTATTSQMPQFPQHQQDATCVVEYPIHLLARKFSEWFFENYNKDQLQTIDFWSDVCLLLRIIASDSTNEYECAGANDVLDKLMSSKLQLGLFFNPNLTHDGVQGRMDVHGLVLVLACGTLHTQQNCVGVFEWTFGLLRDPFAENNWKMKTIQCMLRSETISQTPSLLQCDTLREALSLPVPTGELT